MILRVMLGMFISQNFRDELTRAYTDIDQLKKFRQKNGMKMQQLERFIGRLDLELIEVSIVVMMMMKMIMMIKMIMMMKRMMRMMMRRIMRMMIIRMMMIGRMIMRMTMMIMMCSGDDQ